MWRRSRNMSSRMWPIVSKLTPYGLKSRMTVQWYATRKLIVQGLSIPISVVGVKYGWAKFLMTLHSLWCFRFRYNQDYFKIHWDFFNQLICTETSPNLEIAWKLAQNHFLEREIHVWLSSTFFFSRQQQSLCKKGDIERDVWIFFKMICSRPASVHFGSQVSRSWLPCYWLVV